MAINQTATREATRSAKHTEILTDEMSRLTERTKQETVMMRVISLVTVIFLPGTFISTLMSTDIVSFRSKPDRLGGVPSIGAIKLFLVLTLPLTAVTLVGWYAAYLYFNKERRSRARKSDSPV